jgi:hypothetical protein
MGIVLGISIFLLLAIGSINSGEAEKVSSPSTKENAESNKDTKKESNTTENDEQEKPPQIFKIGDEIKFDNAIYTANSVRTSKVAGILKPKEGNIYYIVDVTVENKSSESLNVSSLLMFKLGDSQGYSYNITINTDAKGQVDGEIQAGKKLRGELTFEVPESETKFELNVDPSIFGSGKFTVDLSK